MDGFRPFSMKPALIGACPQVDSILSGPLGQHLIQMVRLSAWTLEGGENGEQGTCQ